MTKIEFETVPVGSLRPYERNARLHSSRQIGRIAKSISEFGFTNPPLIDERGEIIAGHGRVAAAKQLKLQTIPIIRVSGLSEIQKRSLRLADNKLALDSEWSIELLTSELADLTVSDFDITLTGFDSIEVDKLTTPTLTTNDLDGPLADPPAVPVSQAGDLWALGDHLVAVGDARDAALYRLLLGSRLADLVIVRRQSF